MLFVLWAPQKLQSPQYWAVSPKVRYNCSVLPACISVMLGLLPLREQSKGSASGVLFFSDRIWWHGVEGVGCPALSCASEFPVDLDFMPLMSIALSFRCQALDDIFIATL